MALPSYHAIKIRGLNSQSSNTLNQTYAAPRKNPSLHTYTLPLTLSIPTIDAILDPGIRKQTSPGQSSPDSMLVRLPGHLTYSNCDKR